MASLDDVTGDVAEVDAGIEHDEPAAIDRAIVKMAGELRNRDLTIGRSVRFVFETGLWRALGYATFGHFVRERLGMSRAAVQSKMALVRRCEALREEVAAGLIARTSGARGAMAPPDEATVAAVQAVERAVLAREPVPEIQTSVAPGEAARPARGRVPLRVNVAGDVADLWMAVRGMFEARGEARSFVAALRDNIDVERRILRKTSTASTRSSSRIAHLAKKHPRRATPDE